ncbi:MAG: PP2C family protein-serine/threonine phosphatase [Desulfovibrionaceae bacterium]
MGQDRLQRLLARPEVGWVLRGLEGLVALTGPDGAPLAGTWAPGNGEDAPAEQVSLGGDLLCTVHGPEAAPLARLLSALLCPGRELAAAGGEDGSGEEEFRELTLALASELQLEPLLRRIMAAATRILDADRSTLFLHDETSDELWTPVAQGLGGREIRLPSTRGVAGAAFTERACVNIPDAYADPRFNPDLDAATGYRTSAILCCPVVNKQGRAIGAIQALNKRGGPFTERDAQRLMAFAAQASLAIENARLYRDMEEKVRERTAELRTALDTLSGELRRAAHYVRQLIPGPFDERGIRARGAFEPSADLGGDAFGYHWLDRDHFAVYLTDVSGHGVGAALLSVSITNVLRAHALPDTDFRSPARVLAALNAAFPMTEQGGMFFTMWYGVYHRPSRTLRYASGGHPPALLFMPSGCRELRTPNMLMGGMREADYREDECRVEPGSALVVFSDGCYEIERRGGGMWTLAEFAARVGELRREEEWFGALLTQVRAMSGRAELEDDFSLLEVRFG